MPVAQRPDRTPYRPRHADGRMFFVREAPPDTLPDVPKPRLLDRVRAALRVRHYSRRTEEAYVAWIRRFILFHGKRHPVELGGPGVARFLSWLAVEGRVAASTGLRVLECCRLRV